MPAALFSSPAAAGALAASSWRCRLGVGGDRLLDTTAQAISIEGRRLSFSVASKHSAALPILKDCSLRVPAGQLWMLLGLNGCGKSTLLKRPIQTLSGGQKQRVAIAGALAEACKVLLLDELTTFLDEYDQLGVIKAVKNCVSSNGEVAALWVTHRLEELKYADGAFYMENGRIVTHGDVPSIIDFLKQKQANYIEHFNL
ncbi:hypothetical protein KFK09_020785 [Dendrobium nobile]|uniref:AAA+ ATPase domain-containing protein n=1 Tax=Dendrobium nobile TaxID=94219 RepID=A0A8T3ANE7_DENNO|nr:hypothetical protein KFK09_020785 [Dendrobium nobile]